MNQGNQPAPNDYTELLAELKERIRSARVRAGLSVNRELMMLYWQIGREILTRQQSLGWGVGVVEKLADDLRREFPGMKGLSRTNLLYMRRLAEVWPGETEVQQLV